MTYVDPLVRLGVGGNSEWGSGAEVRQKGGGAVGNIGDLHKIVRLGANYRDSETGSTNLTNFL